MASDSKSDFCDRVIQARDKKKVKNRSTKGESFITQNLFFSRSGTRFQAFSKHFERGFLL